MQFLRRFGVILGPVAALVAVVLARGWLLLAGDGVAVPSTTALGALATQMRPPPQILSSERRVALLSAPLPEDEAAALAGALTRELVVERASVATDIEFRDVFRREVSELMRAQSPELRTAIADYVANPFADSALRGFDSSGRDWATLRRFAILAQPVRPLVALEAYFKADDLRPDPFLQIQAINLSAAIGDFQTARSIQTAASRRWSNDGKVQAILLAKDGMLDLMTGSWGTWQAKYQRALALNLSIGRWEGAASNALVLGDISNRRLYEEGEIGGGDAYEAAPFLRQALDLATRAKADDLAADALFALANLSLVGDDRVGIGPNEASALRERALDAALKHGDLGVYLRMAAEVVTLEAQGQSLDRADAIARRMQAVAETHGALGGVAAALTLQSDIAIERRRFEDARRLLGEADGHAAFLSLSERGNLELAHARLENAVGATAKGCQHLRNANRHYQKADFAEGVSFAEEFLRQYNCTQ